MGRLKSAGKISGVLLHHSQGERTAHRADQQHPRFLAHRGGPKRIRLPRNRYARTGAQHAGLVSLPDRAERIRLRGKDCRRCAAAARGSRSHGALAVEPGEQRPQVFAGPEVYRRKPVSSKRFGEAGSRGPRHRHSHSRSSTRFSKNSIASAIRWFTTPRAVDWGFPWCATLCRRMAEKWQSTVRRAEAASSPSLCR